MSILSDRALRTRLNYVGERTGEEHDNYTIGITPFTRKHLQPASIDLTLDNEFLTYPDVGWGNFIDINDIADVQTTRHENREEIVLFPGKLVLASTAEYIEVPHDLIAVVNGKSSLARLGLLIHITAGFIDPGFQGKITLEMYNLNKKPIILRAGKPICQLSFIELSSVVECPYGHPALKSKYQNQQAVTASRYDG